MSFTGYLLLTTLALFCIAQATGNRTVSIIAWSLLSLELMIAFFKTR